MAGPLCYLVFAADLYFRRVGLRWPRRPRGLHEACFLIKKPSVWSLATPDTSTSSNSSATQATPASQATPSASYPEAANVTQELFTGSPSEPSRKRAPSSRLKASGPRRKNLHNLRYLHHYLNVRETFSSLLHESAEKIWLVPYQAHDQGHWGSLLQLSRPAFLTYVRKHQRNGRQHSHYASDQ